MKKHLSDNSAATAAGGRPPASPSHRRIAALILLLVLMTALAGCGRRTTEVLITEHGPAAAEMPEAVRASEASSSPAGDPAAIESYVINRNSRVFHRPSCSSVGKIAEKNREDVETTREDLIAQGYDPCKSCKP